MKKILMSIIIVLMVLFFAACGGNDAEVNKAENVNENNTSESTVSEDGQTEYPLTVTDATGDEITIESEPETIVSTSPSETEILFALGLDEKIKGVSDFDDYPEEATEKEKIGGIVEPNEEAIITLEPDIVVTGISIGDEAVDKLKELGLPVYKNDATTLEEIMDNILQIGQVMNANDAAKEVVEKMQADIDNVTEAVADIPEDEKEKVYVEFSPGWTVGSGEFLDELITTAGGINIAADLQGWNEINEEKVIEADPDVIIYAKDMVDFDTDETLDTIIESRDGWDKITAMKEDRLVPVEDNIVTRIGPRVTDALKQFAEAIYPDKYQDEK